jgi:enoyl-CoA hydratase
MSYETILVEQRGAVTLITINRPQALNALNSQILSDLIHAFAAYDADESQRCAVLTGSERAFAAGADIKEMAERGFADMYSTNMFSGWERVTATRKPWLAAVAGYALGGGCEVAMMADFIIAADNAQFGQPEIRLGVAPGMGGSQRLTRAIGKAKAMEMCLTGRNMGAEESERSGLVARVVPADQLIDEAMKTAEAIAGMAPLAALAVSTKASNSSAACSMVCSAPRTRRKGWRLSWPSGRPTGRAADPWRSSPSLVSGTWGAAWPRTWSRPAITCGLSMFRARPWPRLKPMAAVRPFPWSRQ